MGRLFGTNGIRLEFIRGRYDVGFVVKAVRAIATYLGGGDVLLGFDVRLTSMPLVGIIYGTLSMHGINVDVIGPIPTPIHQYLTKAWGYRAGIMVTASHNPPRYNGIKVMGGDGVEVDRSVEEKIEDIFFGEKLAEPVDYGNVGRVNFVNVEEGLREYREHLLSIIDTGPIERRGFRIVADFANSVNSIALPYVLRGLNVRVHSINGHLDGEFPGREPEPRPENLGLAAKAVVESGADFGVAYDGDGDRSMFIDEQGNVIWGDRTGTILAAHLLKPGGIVVTPVSSSIVVKWTVESMGGRVEWTRVGSVDVSHRVMELNAICGFEDNGGFIWPRHHPVRDGVSTTLLMMSLLAQERAKLSELNSKMPKMYTARDRIEIEREVARRVVEELKGLNWGGEAITIDGIRVNYGDSWFLVRPSGTENLIRITVEALNETRFRELRDMVLSKVHETISRLTKT